jgi:hypothetical protein
MAISIKGGILVKKCYEEVSFFVEVDKELEQFQLGGVQLRSAVLSLGIHRDYAQPIRCNPLSLLPYLHLLNQQKFVEPKKPK